MAVAQGASGNAQGRDPHRKSREERDSAAHAVHPLVRRVGEPTQQNHAGIRGVSGPGTVGNKSRRTDTKAHKCIALAATGMSHEQIAHIVRCHPAYVRVAIRRGSGDRRRARLAGRTAYREAKAAGQSPRDASIMYGHAYVTVMDGRGANDRP